MAVSRDFRIYIVEQLERVTPVIAKPMFGGVGLYAQELFFALIAEDRLYFKVDDSTRGDFVQHGMEPFRPYGEEHAMGYYEIPADVLEDSEELEQWMRKAIAVAAKAKPSKIKQSSGSAGKARGV